MMDTSKIQEPQQIDPQEACKRIGEMLRKFDDELTSSHSLHPQRDLVAIVELLQMWETLQGEDNKPIRYLLYRAAAAARESLQYWEALKSECRELAIRGEGNVHRLKYLGD